MHIPHEINLIESFCLWVFSLSQKCINFSGYVVNAPLLTRPVEHREPVAHGRTWEHPALAAPTEPPALQSPPQYSQSNTGAQSQVGTVPCPGSSQDSPREPTTPWHGCDTQGSQREQLSAHFGQRGCGTLWEPGEEHSRTVELIAGWQDPKVSNAGKQMD